jgi:rod shape-determining protein MreD
MTGRSALAGTALVVLALVVQAVVLARLPLPGGSPDLVLVLVIVLGLLRGPAEGMLAGFGAGLAVDLLSVPALGSAALVLCATGWLAGLLARDAARSAVATLAVVGLVSAVATGALAVLLVLTGQPHAGPAALLGRVATTAAYDVALAPVVVWALAHRSRRSRRPAMERLR